MLACLQFLAEYSNTVVMENGISEIERRVLVVLQRGLPEGERPYEDMAEEIGIETEQLLAVLEGWRQCGKLRRVGAFVNHFKVGLSAGAMVAWQVEAERVEEVGQIFAEFEQVSHCYERRVVEGWPYNIYTMVHGASDEEVRKTVERMSEACGANDYRTLVTEEELKKVSPMYIVEEGYKV